MRLEEEFAAYLKSKKGCYRLAKACIERYEQMEYLGGSVTFTDLDLQECDDIGGLLQKNISNPVRIKVKDIQKALAKSRFSECDFVETLQIVKGRPFVFKKQDLQEQQEKFYAYYEELLSSYQDTKAGEWLLYNMQNNTSDLVGMKKMWKSQVEDIEIIIQAINQLPIWNEEYRLLAVFAQQMSKNPHYFDEGICATMLVHAIAYLFHEPNPLDHLQKTELYYKAGLLKDDMSNFCMICHISAYYKDKNEHLAWKRFYQCFEPWIVNLYNLNQIDKIKAPKYVFIVENPSTFRTLCMEAKQRNITNTGFICTYGQLNFSAYVLLDKLDFDEVEVYYHGDYDPEGLLIADKLKQRYVNLQLWHYNVSDYLKSLSDNELTSRRLQILGNCLSEQLQPIICKMKELKKAGYQESIHQTLIEDVVHLSDSTKPV